MDASSRPIYRPTAQDLAQLPRRDSAWARTNTGAAAIFVLPKLLRDPANIGYDLTIAALELRNIGS
jgi:hypothetical protein